MGSDSVQLQQPAELVFGVRLGWRREFEGASVVASSTITISSWQLRAACRGPHAEVFFPPEGAEHQAEGNQRGQPGSDHLRPIPESRSRHQVASTTRPKR